jgi:tetratricopeptide (TPR) repeat protein
MVLGFAMPSAAYDSFLDAYREGYQRLQAGEFAVAGTAFRAAVDLAVANSEKGPAWTRVGQCLEGQQKWQEAADAYTEATKLPREDKPADQLRQQRHIEDALKRLGEIYARYLKDEAGVRAVHQRRLEFAGDHPRHRADAMKQIAESYLREKDLEHMVEWMTGAMAEPGLSAHDLSGFRHAFGDFYNRMGQHDEAVAQYRANADTADGHPHRRADSLRQLGEILAFRKQDYAAGRDAFQRVLDMPDSRPDQKSLALLRIAETCRREQEFEKAREVYAEVVGMADAHPHHRGEAQFLLAEVLQRHDRDLPAARDAYARVLAMPDARGDHRGNAQLRIAEIWRDEGNAAEAKAAFEKVLAMDGAHPNTVQAAQRELAKLAD